jgi:hypothetical protein
MCHWPRTTVNAPAQPPGHPGAAVQLESMCVSILQAAYMGRPKTKNGVFLDVTPCGSCKKRVSEEPSPSFISVTRIGELGTLALSSNRRKLRRNTKWEKFEEWCLLGYNNPFRTSQETHYVSTTESSQLKQCKIWCFHGCDYEEWCLLGCYAVWLL